MRPFLLFILLCASAKVNAQTVFLQPEIGLGITNVHVKNSVGITPPSTNATAYQYQINVGKSSGHVVWGTGISYLRTGYENSLSSYYSGQPTVYTKYYWYYYHLTFPFYAGYRFDIGKKINITPTIGPELSYNLSATEQEDGTSTVHHIDNFGEGYDQFSIFGSVRVNAEFSISKCISIVISPEALYMLTNFYNTPGNITGTATQRNSAYLLNAGIKWNFLKRDKKPTTFKKADK